MACYRRKKQDKKCVAYVISGYDVIEVSQMKVIGTEQEIEWIKEALQNNCEGWETVKLAVCRLATFTMTILIASVIS